MVAAPPPPVAAHVTSFELVRINQERERVRPGGSALRCQAIPAIAIDVHLGWRVRATTTARVTVRYPGNRTRTHRVRLARAKRSGVLSLHPRDERIPGDRFDAGRIAFTVSAAGRTTRTHLRLSGGTTC